jgi:hypothetical protein
MTAPVEERAFLHSEYMRITLSQRLSSPRYLKCRFLRPGLYTTQPLRVPLVQLASQGQESSHGSEAPGARESSLHWNGIRRLVPIDYGTSTAIIAPQGHTAPVDLHKLYKPPGQLGQFRFRVR